MGKRISGVSLSSDFKHHDWWVLDWILLHFNQISKKLTICLSRWFFSTRPSIRRLTMGLLLWTSLKPPESFLASRWKDRIVKMDVSDLLGGQRCEGLVWIWGRGHHPGQINIWMFLKSEIFRGWTTWTSVAASIRLMVANLPSGDPF